MAEIPTPANPSRDAHYVAPGAPRSPLVVAALGWVTAVTTAIAWWNGAAVDPVVPISAAIMGTVGLVQNYLARREQRTGVHRLADAVASMPPGADQMIAQAVETALRKGMESRIFAPVMERQQERAAERAQGAE